MYFNIIASGSKGNATIVVENKTVILIDMGISFCRLENGMKEINLTPSDITAAIFTHNHKDHVCGLKFITVKKQYALEGTLPSGDRTNLDLFKEIQIGDLLVTPIAASHDAINPCGYVIKSSKEKLVYLTDTGVFIEDNIPYVSNPDYLIIESNHDIGMLMDTKRTIHLKKRILSDKGHLSNEDSALATLQIVGPNTKEVILAHLSQEANTPKIALKAYDKVFKYFNVTDYKFSIRCASQCESLLGGNYEN
jgi:phosphoribosyl 1,2-cyclic phosphodiesterase